MKQTVQTLSSYFEISGIVMTETAVDAGNFQMSCRVAKDKMLNLISCVILV